VNFIGDINALLRQDPKYNSLQ